MLSKFEKKAADFIKETELFSSAVRILLAVSGGADSTALLYTMYALKAEKILNAELICAHINHQLRGTAADGDENFVITQAQKLNLKVITRRVDVRAYAQKNKLSIETAARQLRIETLIDIAKAGNCSLIAVAHQKNDNAETILDRLHRGTGFRGLGGIWPKRRFAEGMCFVRPLLCVSRDEIIDYLNQRNLNWRSDQTNQDCTYRRNFIRHRLIPHLQAECTGSIVEQLFDISQSAQRFYNMICSHAEKAWPNIAKSTSDKVILDAKSFSNLPIPVKVELIRRSLIYLGSGEQDLIQQHYERILELAQENISGRKIVLPDGFIVRREYDKFIFTRDKKSSLSEKIIFEGIELQVSGQTRFGDYLANAAIFDSQTNTGRYKASKTGFVEWFDLSKLKLPLVVRSRRDGDSFIPLGSKEKKKVGKFLTSQRVPERIRKRILIIEDDEKIIWVWPIRMSEQAKVSQQSRKVLRLEITNAGQEV